MPLMPLAGGLGVGFSPKVWGLRWIFTGKIIPETNLRFVRKKLAESQSQFLSVCEGFLL